MQIFDCFMFYDEEMVLDIRLNYLNNFVDKFVIIESEYTHSGKKRKLIFNINNYPKFKNKIIYIISREEPKNLSKIIEEDDEDKRNSKYILNALKRENFQRNEIQRGLVNVKSDDIIIISDVDEIPKLENFNIKNISKKIVIFKQNLFYYKFNLKLNSFNWHGSKACRKKDLISPQWLRNIKDKKYPFWRLDTFFSKKKYMSIDFVNEGGWHFCNIKTPENIEKKLTTFLHHREYDLEPIGLEKIKEIIKSKKTIHNLKADMKTNKLYGTHTLVVSELNELPIYIKDNIHKFKEWIEKK